jgi:hypothetical protein
MYTAVSSSVRPTSTSRPASFTTIARSGDRISRSASVKTNICKPFSPHFSRRIQLGPGCFQAGQALDSLGKQIELDRQCGHYMIEIL